MKKRFLVGALSACVFLAGCNSNAQPNNQATITINQATITINEQSSELQKAGYAAGYDVGINLKEGANDIDLEAFYQGLKDAYANNTPALSKEQMQQVVQAYMIRKEAEYKKELEKKAADNKAAGEAFLAENAKKEGVKTTASGLQYKVIQEGSGISPTATDTVVVHYEGRLLDGKVFDSSYERGEPASFPLDKVIAGWTEGLQLMKPGAIYEFYVSSDLAYGSAGNADIEPNSTLIFKVELLTEEAAKAALQKAQADQEAQMQQLLQQLQQQSGNTTPTPTQQ